MASDSLSKPPLTTPIEDSVPKVGDVAVGEDLQFQRKWWRFEKIVWWIFLIILICDLVGLFGRGYFAKVKRSAADNTLQLDYERVERASTPSVMTVHFGPAAVQNNQVRLFVSESIVRKLGAQRISPQPISSFIGNGGYTYVFPVDGMPATAEFQLSPSFPGHQTFDVQVVGAAPIHGDVFVVP